MRARPGRVAIQRQYAIAEGFAASIRLRSRCGMPIQPAQAARRSFSSEVNVGLPKVKFRLVTRDAKFASDSPLEQAGFEL